MREEDEKPIKRKGYRIRDYSPFEKNELACIASAMSLMVCAGASLYYEDCLKDPETAGYFSLGGISSLLLFGGLTLRSFFLDDNPPNRGGK